MLGPGTASRMAWASAASFLPRVPDRRYGLIVNALLAAFLVKPTWIGVVATISAVVMWLSFERLSYVFELCADKVVTDKLAASAKG